MREIILEHTLIKERSFKINPNRYYFKGGLKSLKEGGDLWFSKIAFYWLEEWAKVVQAGLGPPVLGGLLTPNFIIRI